MIQEMVLFSLCTSSSPSGFCVCDGRYFHFFGNLELFIIIMFIFDKKLNHFLHYFLYA